MNVESIDICGFVPALRGMRNSFDSHDKSDTEVDSIKPKYIELLDIIVRDLPVIGENDLRLARNLVDAGEPHCKFRRMIQVWMDISAPLYWWKQFDTYKVGTTANSESTMHNITDKLFTLDNFVIPDEFENDCIWIDIIDRLNDYRKKYLLAKENNDRDTMDICFRHIIYLLPESWMQMRTVNLNYSVLAAIYKDRHNHKLHEWREFCKLIECLPYAEELIFRKECDKNAE